MVQQAGESDELGIKALGTFQTRREDPVMGAARKRGDSLLLLRCTSLVHPLYIDCPSGRATALRPCSGEVSICRHLGRSPGPFNG
jgi:hypothetical protein